ncbi:MAG TPA: hypothetical protein VFT29_06110 [Gemmatimonadaceae bacterium]|nr:hypothetical protein [Gemmatimonadaceae bacterium]
MRQYRAHRLCEQALVRPWALSLLGMVVAPATASAKKRLGATAALSK